MPQIEPGEEKEKPLDPAMENVRRKMVRLQLVSAGVMFVSLMAVLAAVVYKVTQSGPQYAAAPVSAVLSDQPLTATAALPLGFEVQSVSLSGNQILFYGRTIDGQNHAIVFDLGVKRIVSDVVVWAR